MTSRLFTHIAASLVLTALLAAPLAAQDGVAETAAEGAEARSAETGWNPADWDFDDSEFLPEAGWVFGRLDNGMRYIIRKNDRPEKTALVRMEIAAGSIDERPEEQGFAHYVEHMAFNGSTNIPEGEMIKLLERAGLAFGANTNASTSFEQTQYRLDLPRADEGLLDTALMLMRETVSELTISPEAVDRERGVILSERRVRNNYNLQNVIDGLQFNYPEARIASRLPIGTIETLEGATAAGLRGFWEREYVPADTVVIVIGDFDPAVVEAKITERFADWAASPSPDQPGAGPVDGARKGQTDIYLDPALTETIVLARHFPYQDRPDTYDTRRETLLYSIAGRALGRRYQRLLRSEDPPFRGVNVSTVAFFDEAETAQISVSTEEGGWQRGLDAAIDETRRALQFGFSDSEIAEQVANLRTAYENAVANAGTRSNASFANEAIGIVRASSVPAGPVAGLERFGRMVDGLTAAEVTDVFRARTRDLTEPLIRFSGKSAPKGGGDALRRAVDAAFARAIAPPEDSAADKFAYTNFGAAGDIITDTRTDRLDIRTIRFANNVRLNLKPTDLEDGNIRIQVAIDGGLMLRTRNDPLAVEIGSLLTSGGLGRHSLDELQSVLAGRSVSGNFRSRSETFVSTSTTTKRDFELQMQLLAAYITDPGYRPEGLGPYRKSLDDFFARLGKTPGSAYSEASRAILSDNDPRFTRQPIDAYRTLDFQKLESVIGGRLRNGAIEIGIVGDFDEEEAIRFVASTFGALPEREADFRPYDGPARERSFTADRGVKTVEHDGEADQAIIRMVWPTTDDTDVELTSRMNLLSRVIRLQITEKLREELGQIYSSSVTSSQSGIYPNYGTFSIGASVDPAQLDAARDALIGVIADLRDNGPDTDVIQRARQPVLEAISNRLKSNGGWMALVNRAQSEPEDIANFLTATERYKSITREELQALAKQYLDPASAVEFRVVPGADVLTQASAD
ncbi:M16 family metallopeptidase [Pontixanthobacter sp.]|uniref:M16 family metallopeptidase n=1 Tax=Pontixanthobacter sp. TaxID=2792078 RepID=UPI003C7E450B